MIFKENYTSNILRPSGFFSHFESDLTRLHIEKSISVAKLAFYPLGFYFLFLW